MDNYDDLSPSEVNDLLRKWRENNERKSSDVVSLWMNVLQTHSNKYGNEKYVLLEQIIYAMLDCHLYGLAKGLIYVLSLEFPSSLRVMRYKAAALEAEEKYDEALNVLDVIINADETNAPARKRRVAVLKAQGLIHEAIKELADYLKKFMSDVEAWQELCELYLQVQEYSRAAFCAEELILHQPHNHLMHQRLADIRYTMGGIENMELAKTYYCQTLKLNPDNLRALLGLFLVANNLVGQYKSSGNSKRKEAWRLSQWAQSRVSAKQRQARAKLGLTDMMLSLSLAE
ncbi:PREDICTED: ER membrane protein complex subunit 2-like [Papilio polytes]|uniref:ER membrane protein complex subunit 2 n=1 Tax=Papilio polytes TaxID=76194 RepID=I4DS74_PAPPL|nr:ER membrane protein complex subunit 2-like [Papilio polytes]XP_013137715.1 PREDICTED: ER membrane protein complex subunit 2-like [Papilio polytes]BAM20764.1 simila to CG17556 [Papilio polytes]